MPGRFAVVPAAHLYLLRGREVLLQQRHGTGYMDGHWVAAAAGHIERGETAADAAAREAREELDVQVEPDDLAPLTMLQRTDGTDDPAQQRADWMFTADRWEGDPRVMEPLKCAGIAWWSLDALPNPLPDYEVVVLRGLAAGNCPRFISIGFVPPERSAG